MSAVKFYCKECKHKVSIELLPDEYIEINRGGYWIYNKGGDEVASLIQCPVCESTYKLQRKRK